MSDQMILGCEYNWWVGDPLPELQPLAGLRVAVVDDVALLARLHDCQPAEIQRRLDQGNHCYLAYLDGEPAGYGWVATQEGMILGAGLKWPLAEQDRHLWDFVTLPQFRGRGVYPHLLQAILRTESPAAEHFWIGHRGDNLASQRGILKAGFKPHWHFVLTAEGRPNHRPQGDPARVTADPRWPIMAALNAPPPELVE